MEDLKELFTARDTAFEEKTRKIFELMNTSLVCVTKFLNSTDPMFEAGKISWEDANLVDDLVVIIGMVHYEPGTIVDVGGSVVSITEENIEYFQRVVHMSLPIKLVTSSNEDDIMQFLHNLLATNQGDDFKDVINNAPSGVNDHPDSIVSNQNSLDFDLTQLSEEQAQAFKFNNNKNNKRN